MPGEYGSKNSINAGVDLTMRPLMGGGDEIILYLKVEVSTLGALDPTTGLPDKTTRKASSTVRVRDGATVIIGGLQQEEERITRRKVPILGDIPLIGNLFRSKRKEKTKVDLAIFVTANVLSPTGHLPAAQEAEIMKRMEIGTQEAGK